MSAPDPNGLHVFLVAAQYLLENGWYRDGDDPGIWLIPPPLKAEDMTFGDAIECQLESDGVSMETV